LPAAKAFTATLEHWHYDTYRFLFNDPFLPYGYITFSKNALQEVEGFKITLPNDDFDFSILDFKPLDD
jgi:hypothetical protein